MRCPFCMNEKTEVVDKRDNEGITKRRRVCLKCEKRFNTVEDVEHSQIRVVKRDGRIEQFNPEKIKKGMLIACEKRPVSLDKIESSLAKIEERIIQKGKEVSSEFIGELVMRELKKLDKVAYIRFASVYRDFQDLSDFGKEIKELK